MRAQNNIPFPPEKGEKTRYMWRDIERRAKKYGIPVPKTPVPYPLKNFDLANKIGLVANKEGWYLEYQDIGKGKRMVIGGQRYGQEVI